MNKKLLGALIAFAMTTSAVGLAACGKDEPSVTLENFTDISAEVELGSVYSLASPVAYDTEGNDYRVIYTVTTESGASVTISNNQISIDKFEPYKILCSVTIGESDIRTRTLTLNVKDKGEPVVKIGEAKLGYVGKEYVLPAVTVSDASGEKIEPALKLFRVEGETETEITTENGKFTPTARGLYRLDVTAKDSSGNAGKASVQFSVRNSLPAFVFEDFDDEYGKSVYTNKLNDTTDGDEVWHETFEGKTGVVSATSTKNQYGPHQYFKFNMRAEELAEIDFEYIYVDLYVHYDAAKGDKTNYRLHSRNTPVSGAFDFDTWVRVKITPEMIEDENSFFSDPAVRGANETPRECFNRLMTSEKGYVLFYVYDESSDRDAYTFYVGEIGWKGSYKPELNLKTEYKLGEYVTLNGTVADLEDYTLSYEVVSPSGVKVTLDETNKFRLVETGEYTVRTVIGHATQSGETTFKFNVGTDKKFTIGEFTGSVKQGEEVSVPAATFGNTPVQTTVFVGDREVRLENGRFIAEFYGDYTVEYSATEDGLVYREIRTITVEKTTKANEVNSFDGADSVNDIVVHNGSLKKVEWLAEYEGEKGVIKITDRDTAWPAFSFFPVQKMSSYEDYDYLVFKVFLPSDTETYNEFCLLNGAGAQYRNPEKGKWAEVQFDIGTFKQNWKDNRDEMDLVLARVFSGETSKGEVVIYIADIYAAKTMDKSGITVTPECAGGELLNGGEITLTVVNPDQAEYVLTLFGTDGNEIALDGGKFTGVTGSYSYKLTAQGYIGEITGAFEVKAGARKTFTVAEHPTTVKQGAEITIPGAVYEGVTATVDSVKIAGQTVQTTDGKFVAAVYGEYIIEYIAVKDGMMFMDSVTITVEKEAKANEINSFDGADCVNGIVATGGTTKTEWLHGFNGESGVVKITYTGARWPAFAFFPVQQMSAYDGYDYLIFKVFLSETYPAFNLYNGSGCQYRSPEKGKWVEVQFDIGTFKQYWKDNRDEMDLSKTIICTDTPASADDELVLYIADIYAVKAINRSGITVTPECTDGELLTGNEITLTVVNPDQADYALTLFGPDGKEVALDGGKFTGAAGTYSYKITAQGYIGEITGSFEVLSALAIEISEQTETYRKGDELPYPGFRVLDNGVATDAATVNVTVRYGNDIVDVNGKKFTALYAGTYTVTYEAELGSGTAEKTVTVEVLETDCLVRFDHEEKLSQIYTQTASTKEFISAEKIAENTGLPALPDGESGYVRLTGKANEWGTFAFGVRNDFFTAQMLKENDYIDVTLYFAGANNLRIYWYNHRLNETTPTAEKGKWVTLRMPIGMFSQTEHTGRQFKTVEEFENAIATEKFLDLYDWSMTENEVVYIASMKLVKEAADTTLGDRFVNLTKETWQDVVRTKGDVLSWDDTENALKIEAGAWQNLWITAGRNFSELHEYSKIRVIMKGLTSSRLFVQNDFWTTGNQVAYYQITAGEDGISYLDINMDVFLKYYYRVSRGADETFSDNRRALFIFNDPACTCYLKDIVLVK